MFNCSFLQVPILLFFWHGHLPSPFRTRFTVCSLFSATLSKEPPALSSYFAIINKLLKRLRINMFNLLFYTM